MADAYIYPTTRTNAIVRANARAVLARHTHTAATGGGRFTYSHFHANGADPHDHLQPDADAKPRSDQADAVLGGGTSR